MNFRIRSKFIGILVIASLLPLSIALIAFRWFGEHFSRQSEGIRFEEAAMHFSDSMTHTLASEIKLFNQWCLLSAIASTIDLEQAARPDQIEAKRNAIQATEALWPTLGPDSPILQALLQNELSLQIQKFMANNLHFAEIFITDRMGRLIASTQKTSDYWQADEAWWQAAILLDEHMLNLEGLNYDESAQVYSIDITLPLYQATESGREIVGVIKAVLDASHIFYNSPLLDIQDLPTQEVVLNNGQVLVNIQNNQMVPLSKQINPKAAARLRGTKPGWALEYVDHDEPSVIGFAPIHLYLDGSDLQVYGLRPMWAVIYRDDESVMAPVNRRVRHITQIGILLVSLFAWTGYAIASRKIIQPIAKLRLASEAVSRTVRLEEQPKRHSKKQAALESSMLLREVRSIQTKDEIGQLAQQFAFMGERILGYQAKLESEIALKTDEIESDLQFAREFQVKMMPQKYPHLESPVKNDMMGLDFNHIYKPASSVSGDFFDVLKLSNSTVGIFIADVMGHGVRSALVTAILTTLMHNIKSHADQPAEFLQLLNSHFHKMIYISGELIFASAFYLVLDLEKKTARYASAGHPSPLLVDRRDGKVVPLTPHLTNNPALGLFSDCKYQTFSRAINKHDLFLMFTDGVFECSDGDGVEFGQDRLLQLVENNQSTDLHSLMAKIANTIKQYTEPHGLDDDICLVGVEFFERSS
ncbi:MAG: SpoIIE family protein phosphatase [Opitutae bacterium]|nr:SpoIIE family protein phosphatase [Opitutae bacterium]MDG1302064.1 SpoIIE family protein phosphatase [Opitutae bacterium]